MYSQFVILNVSHSGKQLQRNIGIWEVSVSLGRFLRSEKFIIFYFRVSYTIDNPTITKFINLKSSEDLEFVEANLISAEWGKKLFSFVSITEIAYFLNVENNKISKSCIAKKYERLFLCGKQLLLWLIEHQGPDSRIHRKIFPFMLFSNLLEYIFPWKRWQWRI